MRTKTFGLRVNREEAKRFHSVARHYGVPMSAMLRMLVKEREMRIEQERKERSET